MSLYIRDFNNPENVAHLQRDVCHQHPSWVHNQMGTSSESELQAVLDFVDLDTLINGDPELGLFAEES